MPVTVHRIGLNDETVEQSIRRVMKDASSQEPLLNLLENWRQDPSEYHLWFADFNERTVGIALLKGTELKGLRVHRATRRRGIGRRMVAVLREEYPDFAFDFSAHEKVQENWLKN